MSIRKAVIMAGGFGTRLRPLTMSIPKPMVPVANRPMMEHIVELLKRHGIRDVVSLLYFQPEHITEFFGEGTAHDISMRYMLAEADFGTAGSVKNAESFLDERFIIISGDVLTDIDIEKAVAFHEERGAMATIVLTRVPQPLQYGIVMTDDNGRITRFLEKPSWGEVFSDTINTGIYILEPDVMDLIPPKTEFDFSKDLYPLMLQKGLPLFGYVADGYWKDIGNLHEYQLAHDDVLAGRVRVELKGEKCDSSYCGAGLQLSPTAELEGLVIIGDEVVIGDHVRLTNCVIGDGCTIGAGASIDGAVLWNDVNVGEFVEITHAVVCNDTTIGSQASIGENAIVAEDCVIGNDARLVSGVKLWPRKVVESHAVVTHSLVQEERWSRELFTDARISGISNIEVNPEFSAKLGAALGTSLGAGTTIIASRDDDAVSRMIKRSITAGLMSAGINVSDLQTTSIPQTRQELHSGKYVAGFHVRRSPKKHGFTDIILFGKDGRDIPLAQTKSVERFFFGEDIKRVEFENVGRLAFPERSTAMYIERFLTALNTERIRNRQFNLLVDYSFGLAATVFPQILGELKCRTLGMNSYVDASHFADPLAEVLDESSIIMRSLGYEIGFKIDPGVEKIALVDERGIWYTSLRLLSIVTKLFLDTNRQHEPYLIAIPVQATEEIEKIAAGYNVEVVRIRNSHGAMMEATKDDRVRFVGGTRGGFIFPEFLQASDGMYTACRILDMLAQTDHQLSELDRTLPKRHQSTVSVPCPYEARGTVMRKAMEHSEGMQRLLVDGVRVSKDGVTVLLAPDKEEALFTITAEADSADQARSTRDTYAELVTQWRDGQ
ncbi:MAG: NTP transferase domain-containing protein [Candidatus Kapabacteria bacterium]|nr:NTP transferase domain-containing protein [Ignavibacteria bacterium]MBP6509786.1 NTP transferase domain-containing protein [Candidatus Kapabacteria bacterium]MBK6420520.1 NTP transferase domain-containing protein [Ignavibacteria bacterium]MBK6761524.1 NTP transferase domain-containing protein [Ignavibacteria bacterium]MBK7033548.1 NTP transferase domain-containing protein [Ignavibacteria bacterium]